MSLPPTPASIVRNVLQGIVGLLDLSPAEQVQVQIPLSCSLNRSLVSQFPPSFRALGEAPHRDEAAPIEVAT
jgi:hypothetical protein